MKIVVGISPSDTDLAALHQAIQLFRLTEVTLVHAVDLGLYFELSVAVEDSEDAGRQLLEKAAALVPSEIKTVRQINESANPAQLILETADTYEADLVVVGTRGRSRLTEAFVGSVSARVFLHTSRSTLIVKGPVRKIERALVAIEGEDDADRITQWLTNNPLAAPAELRVFHALETGGTRSQGSQGTRMGPDEPERKAQQLVKETARRLSHSPYTVDTKIAAGKPVAMIQEQAEGMDLVVVSSHGRTGMSRFLVGSVSHNVVHDVPCPVLIVR